MAFDFTCLQTRAAKSRSSICGDKFRFRRFVATRRHLKVLRIQQRCERRWQAWIWGVAERHAARNAVWELGVRVSIRVRGRAGVRG